MPLTNANLLSFSAPLWMPAIAWLITLEKSSTATWFGAALGFVGVVLVLQPHHHRFNVGTLFALAAALLLAVALMSVRWLGATEPMPRILLYHFLLSTVMAIPIAAIQWHSVPGQAWIYLLGIGFAQLFAQVLIVLAYRYASALIDWVVWHHPPTLFVVVGMVLVIGGGLVAIRGKSEAPITSIES
jgi:drug/metabolite transporter (DMT)-like permease